MMDHVKTLSATKGHLDGWAASLAQAEAVIEAAAVLESPPPEYQRAVAQYSKAAAALLGLANAIETTTGQGSEGVATEMPWAWFSTDTSSLFRRSRVGAASAISALERLAARGYAPGGGGAARASASASASAPAAPRGGGGTGRPLTAEELDVLRRTSVIQGKTYVPWVDSDRTSGFGGAPRSFVDPDGPLALSPSQQRHFKGWTRPGVLFKDPCMLRGARPSAFSVTQDLVGTCSFLSSLCAAAQFERRTGIRLISASVYPQDASGRPVLSPSGRYVVRLHLNGAWRRVVVDDLLPAATDGSLLCSHSSVEGELWVSVLEKAFLKVVGSYAFAGSTSSKDLHVLTGWLPETLKVGGKDFDPERSWERILGGFSANDVLVTAGTGPMPEGEEERLGLVSSHAYAVLDVRQVPRSTAPAVGPAGAGGPLRLLQVKNPWGRRRFQGSLAYSRGDVWTPRLRAALGVSEAEGSAGRDDGVFWCTWEEALQCFSSVYLSWRPVLLPHRQRLHGQWLKSWPGPVKDNHSFMMCPQYRLVVGGGEAAAPCGAVVWILVSRHVTAIETDTKPAPAPGPGGVYVPRGTSEPAEAADSKDFLALHVFAPRGALDASGSHNASTGVAAGVGFGDAHAGTDRGGATSADGSSGGVPLVACSSGAFAGDRVYFPGDAALQGVYNSSPYIVSKLCLPPSGGGAVPLTLVLSQMERRRDISYTVAAFSSAPCTLEPVPRSLSCFAAPVVGRWGPGRDGGRGSSERYFENPQLLLETTQEDDVQLTLRGPSAQSISFRVFGATGGEKVSSLRAAKAFEPKFYMKCFNTAIRRSLPPGKYTVVLSCWDAGHHAGFELLAAGQAHIPRLALLT